MKSLAMFIYGAIFGVVGMAVSTHAAPLPGGTLDPTIIPKYVEPLPIPSAMPKAAIDSNIDFYQIAVRQFAQQILPRGLPKTTVWGYGSTTDPDSFSYPAHTIEAVTNRTVRVQWINELVTSKGRYLPHLLPVDQTLHWANPPQECLDGARMTDCRGKNQKPYRGPVPLVPHVHGAHSRPESDGYPEAWFLPDARNIPPGYATRGSHYSQIAGAADLPGQALYQYPNDQRSTTLWFHDHTLGMTRNNVYTGLAGFYLLRDPATDPAGLPAGNYEIPLAIQDKSFNKSGSLFYPANRAFFEEVKPSQLKIPFIPDQAAGGMSDVSPIWNPEFFGNTMVVNGKTWPKLRAEAHRYRLRLLNGCDSRVLILKIVAGKPAARPGTSVVPFWQIGSDGGFLPQSVKLDEVLLGPGERADVVVDFGALEPGTVLYLINEGPDEPFGGGTEGREISFADPQTTGQVMKIVIRASGEVDTTTSPDALALPPRAALDDATNTRTVSLNEAESSTVFVAYRSNGSIVFNPSDPAAVPFAPVAALLGTASVGSEGEIVPVPKTWMEPITENPGVTTEIWEIANFTVDAHPIHLHQVQFEVVNRQEMEIDPNGRGRLTSEPVPPEAWETGTKDTVLVYPGTVTRVKASFDLPGLYVWHCHILSHEDNEMMRPFCVGPLSNCR